MLNDIHGRPNWRHVSGDVIRLGSRDPLSRRTGIAVGFSNGRTAKRVMRYPTRPKSQPSLIFRRWIYSGMGGIGLRSGEDYAGKDEATLVSTGESSGGYGRTTRNATSGWQHRRKQATERDSFRGRRCSVH